MKRFLTRLFSRDDFSGDDGAVSVDWVVLTAAITVLAAAAILSTESGVEQATETIRGNVAGKTVR